MSGRLLIVGGTGFIGRHLAVKAVQDYKVTVLSLTPPADKLMVKGVDYLQADITNLAKLKISLSNISIDYVVNLSGYIEHTGILKGGDKVIDIHFNGVQNLIQAINWKTLKRFVQIGSSDEYGDLSAPQHENMRESPISPYSLAKLASTHFLQMLFRTDGFPSVILRPFLVYGPGQNNMRFLPQIIKGCLLDEDIPVSAGEQLRDLCYIDDVTQGILMTLANNIVNGEVINIASGKPVVIRNIIEKVKNIIGKGNPKFGVIPYRTGENMELYADISKAKKILGWTPGVSIDEGIEKTINAYREEFC